MNAKEIIEKLEELEELGALDVSEFAHEGLPDLEYVAGDVDLKAVESILQELGTAKEVSHYGGEGKGDTWYSVFHFTDHDVHLKVDGWYSSYNGTDFEGWEDSVKEVKPMEKTITVYE